MHVELVHLPDDGARLPALRAAGTPRLLLVGADQAPPKLVDDREDWVWLPLDPAEVIARIENLERRMGEVRPIVQLDEDGLVRVGDRWVALPPMEERLIRLLLANFGAVVTRQALREAAWPAGAPSPSALTVQMVRLRSRVETVGLTVRTVRGRGYVLSWTDPETKDFVQEVEREPLPG